MELTASELDYAKEIANISLAKAGDALSVFVRQKTIIRSHSVSLEGITPDSEFTKMDSEEITVLKTEIKGEFHGNCYLLFSRADKEKILDLTLPPAILNDPARKEEHGNSVLLEIDNIITASAVTQFSNILKYSMYGFIPFISVLTSDSVNPYLYSENKDKNFFLRIRTKFITDKDRLEPEFIWFMDQEKFIQSIRNFK